MFVRVIRKKDEKEILVNTTLIWKIEVEFGIPGKGGKLYETTLEEGTKNAGAVRIYTVFVGDEKIKLAGTNPDDPVFKVFEQIYKDALKSSGPPKVGPTAKRVTTPALS